MKVTLRKILRKLLDHWGYNHFSYVSWWRTWAFNLRYFDLKTALKRPVFIYNDTDVFWIGKVVLDAKNIYKGMIRIGYWPMKAHNRTRIAKGGTIIFHGSLDIWGGAIIEGGGTLEFGDNVMLGESSKIMNEERMVFEDHIRVGYDCTFMDTDYHYIIDTQTHKAHRNKGEVVIGEGTWISSTCKIMKGTRLPKNSIVGGGSLVNHDFSAEEPCQIFVGTPAKPVKSNQRRIFNVKVEDELNKYFKEHPEEKSHIVEVDDIDELCYSNFFRNR